MAVRRAGPSALHTDAHEGDPGDGHDHGQGTARTWEAGEALNDRERTVTYGAPAMEAAFSPPEYRRRLDRVRAGMTEAGIDLLYLMAPESMCYLSGYQNEWYQGQSPKAWAASSGLAVHVDHDRFIFFDSPAEALLGRASSVATDIRHTDRATAIPFIVGELKAAGWLPGRVGLEMWSYRPNRVVSERFQAAFEGAGCAVVDGTDVVREARRLKSPQELATMEIAARIADIGLAAAHEALRPGVTELEVYGEVIAAMAKGRRRERRDHPAGPLRDQDADRPRAGVAQADHAGRGRAGRRLRRLQPLPRQRRPQLRDRRAPPVGGRTVPEGGRGLPGDRADPAAEPAGAGAERDGPGGTTRRPASGATTATSGGTSWGSPSRRTGSASSTTAPTSRAASRSSSRAWSSTTRPSSTCRAWSGTAC
jgi:hypothetical protein